MKKNKTICVITLTFNRPEYIKRSFDSLYARAGHKFTHYVFDDHSDTDTLKLLTSLQKKYKFKLFTSNKRANIYNNFKQYLHKVPLHFDYYLKLDSDIEILSDNLLVHLLDISTYNNGRVAGITPRIEGVLNADRYGGTINFYNGHAIKIDSPVAFGCCLLLSKHFFAKYAKNSRVNKQETWGIDAELYTEAKELGHFITVEDVSVYHIDNMYGQRRNYSEYFLKRKRWENIDVNDTSFLLASKYLYPKYIKTVVYKKLIQETFSFKHFLKKCKTFTKQKHSAGCLNIQITDDMPENDLSAKCQVFKIISPNNFPQIKELKHGTYKYYKTVPKWATNNPSVCIKLVIITVKEYLRQS